MKTYQKNIITFLLAALFFAIPAKSELLASPSRVPVFRTNNPSRPHMPANDVLECYYEDGQISIEFYNPEGTATVEIINLQSGFGTLDFINTEYIEYVDVLRPGYSMMIRITTSEGNIYEGEFGILPSFD